MRTLRIDLRNGMVDAYGERTYQQICDPQWFWDQWNSPLNKDCWHRTELDRDGNPYTVKWYSNAFHNGAGAWMTLTLAWEVDGHYPANTQPPAQPQGSIGQPEIPPTQRGRANVGERLRSPHGTWTVARSWRVTKKNDDGTLREGTAYLLTHDDGHQEEWLAPDMADADFHRILPKEQQTLS